MRAARRIATVLFATQAAAIGGEVAGVVFDFTI